MGYKIKEVRESLKMTQEELASKSGVSRGTISALENGKKRTTSVKTLKNIASALGTTVSQIFFE
jgi:transcriptional regulator with XRE-family HTH domain